MSRLSKDELLVKTATILRLPLHHNIALEGGGTGYVYDKEIVKEILDEIALFFVARP